MLAIEKYSLLLLASDDYLYSGILFLTISLENFVDVGIGFGSAKSSHDDFLGITISRVFTTVVAMAAIGWVAVAAGDGFRCRGSCGGKSRIR